MTPETFEEYNIEIRPGARGDVKVFCPECHGSRRNKYDKSLSVNVEKGVWHCHNCGWSGVLKGHNGVDWRNQPKREYVKPEREVPPQPTLTERAEKFFADRKISKEVLERRQIFTDADGLHFPYYRDGALVNIKTRRPPKQFSMEKGAELIMYGLDDCLGQDTLILVEGEMDVLAIESATGWTNVLSVPNGAAKNATMAYLESAEHLFDAAHTVILATDSDEPGQELEQELARRIGKEKCQRVEWPEGCKDANDVLIKHGPAAVERYIKQAQPYPGSGIISLKSAHREYMDLYHGIFVKGSPTGWNAVDELYSVRTGELTIVQGAPSSGKSEWLDALMVSLARRKDENWRFVVFSPENLPIHLHGKKLAEKYVGKPFRANLPNAMSENDAILAEDWIDKHFTFLAPEEPSMDEILRLAHQRILQNGAKGVVIDPWNEVMNRRPGGISETDFVGQCLSKIRKFAQNHGVHFWVVNHPTKLPKDETGEYIVPGPYDSAGSANWFNRADNFITVWRKRNYEEGEEIQPVQLHVQKIRWKDIGKLGIARLHYQWETGRYFDVDDDPNQEATYSQMDNPWD